MSSSCIGFWKIADARACRVVGCSLAAKERGFQLKKVSAQSGEVQLLTIDKEFGAGAVRVVTVGLRVVVFLRLHKQLFSCILTSARCNGHEEMTVGCYYYVTSSGKSPVREFIESLDPKTQRKFFFVKSLLESLGRQLPQPHAKYIGDDIFEIRFSGKEGAIRVLYFFFHKDRIIFTNGFVKKSRRTPSSQKKLAVDRRREILTQD